MSRLSIGICQRSKTVENKKILMHQQSQNLAGLYPQARKLQYDLKSQLDYLESGRGKGSSESLYSARQNLSQLQQFMAQLETMIQQEPMQTREMWKK